MNFQKNHASDMIKQGNLIFLFTTVEILRQATIHNRANKRSFKSFLDNSLLKDFCGQDINRAAITENYNSSDYICLAIDKQNKKIVGFSFIKKNFRLLGPCIENTDKNLGNNIAGENEMYIELLCTSNQKEGSCPKTIGVGSMLSVAIALFIKRTVPEIVQIKLSSVVDVVDFWKKMGYLLRSDSCDGKVEDESNGYYKPVTPKPLGLNCDSIKNYGKQMKLCIDNLFLQEGSSKISSREISDASIDHADEFEVKLALDQCINVREVTMLY